MMKFKRNLKKLKHFIFDDDSALSWIVSVALAFLVIKYILYPGLGLILGTPYPIVAVVSGSMEHPKGFDDFWHSNEGFYSYYNITETEFKRFPFKNGFNKGDIMILVGARNIKIGDVIVFQSQRDPIIHRVIKIWDDEGMHYQTKGDNNLFSIKDPSLDETDIRPESILGKAGIKIPVLGWIKITAVCTVDSALCNIDSYNCHVKSFKETKNYFQNFYTCMVD